MSLLDFASGLIGFTDDIFIPIVIQYFAVLYILDNIFKELD
jgi:hypothetical protein